MNNIFVSWKQKIESRIISDLKSQYTESEEQIRQLIEVSDAFYNRHQAMYGVQNLL